MEAAAGGLKKVGWGHGLVTFEVPAAKVAAPGTQGWGGELGLISHSCVVYYNTLRCLKVLEAGSPQWVS